MKKIFFPSLFICATTIFIVSCNTGLTPLSDDENDQLQLKIDTASANSNLITHAGRGSAEQLWLDINGECFASKHWSHAIYLGLSNNNSIGTIMDKDGGFVNFSPGFTAADSAKVFGVDSVQNLCTEKINKQKGFNLLFGVVIKAIGGANLAAEFSKSIQQTVTGGTFCEISTASTPFNTYVDNLPATEQAYKDDYNNKKNRVVVGAIWVKDFSADLVFSPNDSVGIALNKDTTISGTSNGIKGSVSYHFTGTDSISIHCISSFVPLVIYGKK